MAEFLQQQTLQATSPVTGAQSPGSPGGHKVTRTEAKKELTDEVALLISAIKQIQVYAEALAEAKSRLAVAGPDEHGRHIEALIGRQEFGEFKRMIYARMKALPKLAFTLNKTRRRVAANSGFKAPARFQQPIVDFFSQANLGPQVTGDFTVKTDKGMNMKNVPVGKSLQVQGGTDLNNLLYFIQPQIAGQQNPLYGIVASGTLTPLFALHAYHTNMQTPDDAARLSASAQMRTILGDLMADTIRNDIKTVVSANPSLAQQGAALEQQLIQAVRNPNMMTRPGENELGGVEIFNPNFFLYAHFSKLISNSKIVNEDPTLGRTKLTDAELSQLRPQIARVYSNVPELNERIRAFPQTYQENVDQGVQPPAQGELPYEQVVLGAQQDNVSLSRAYKNQVKQKADRDRKKEEKRQQQQQQQGGVGAMLPGGPQAGFQFGQVSGLPGGQQFGQMGSLAGLGR